MDNYIKDKIIYITGGAKGIGKAIVRLFCENGADVIFCDIDVKESNKLCNELSSYKCSYHEVDISDSEALELSINKAIEEKGNIDVLLTMQELVISIRYLILQ